jgi:hypothetical protein
MRGASSLRKFEQMRGMGPYIIYTRVAVCQSVNDSTSTQNGQFEHRAEADVLTFVIFLPLSRDS